jgi:hypothetical protein
MTQSPCKPAPAAGGARDGPIGRVNARSTSATQARWRPGCVTPWSAADSPSGAVFMGMAVEDSVNTREGGAHRR